ncbi:hypothetical protein HETIRDRAFT_433420 [Heterobasidion irregulare TC 32-1]|uniref:Uncharacterized protein n=1 Tax=Heterobasidion irregulare (strain TC 32-1) TaxID=747525 RepID=W4KFV9_HETIT|nr:uncharacterized protein HETIRDRAFT_433420 [Heterobasidion irregulare TC 32-1]ETW84732.1 hypothetical protein HETIRDRAFT_433420 [Heterobasidion irregulare TC 32-1]
MGLAMGDKRVGARTKKVALSAPTLNSKALTLLRQIPHRCMSTMSIFRALDEAPKRS